MYRRSKRTPLAERMEAWREQQRSQPHKHVSLPFMTREEWIKHVASDANLEYRCTIERIYSESLSCLQKLGRAVKEGKQVEEANNFLRWLQFSGVIKLLESHATLFPQFKQLRREAADLQYICQPHLKGQRAAY